MIRVLVLYQRQEGKKFDLEYYKNFHLPLVKDRLSPVKMEIDLGTTVMGKDSPYIAITYMYFDSVQQLAAKYFFASAELNEDVEKFTDTKLVFQISEIVEM